MQHFQLSHAPVTLNEGKGHRSRYETVDYDHYKQPMFKRNQLINVKTQNNISVSYQDQLSEDRSLEHKQGKIKNT